MMPCSALGKPLLSLLLVAIVGTAGASIAGCSAKAPARHDWTRRDGASQDLEKTREECLQRATDATAKTPHDRVAADVIINEFLKCMREKGWELDDEDEDDD